LYENNQMNDLEEEVYLSPTRNSRGLSPEEIDQCVLAFEFLLSNINPTRKLKADLSNLQLDISIAHEPSSETKFLEEPFIIKLGADAIPGTILTANAQLSHTACLAHEIAHAERFKLGYERPFSYPENLIDEAETSLHASLTCPP
jgi:hypothetical protein